MKAGIYTNEEGDITKVVDLETGQEVDFEEYEAEEQED